jgi:dihydroorotase
MKKLQLIICMYFLVITAYCQVYDFAIIGGTVIDPETNFIALRNVGITGNQIAEITSEDISGKQTIDATGLVVSPGFIDLHVHGMTNDAHRYQVRDGVTTALELESGIPFLSAWIKEKSGNSIVNFGATIPHMSVRSMAMEQYIGLFEEAQKAIREDGYSSPRLTKLQINLGRSAYQSLDESAYDRVELMVKQELESGALGIGVPVGYYPGSTAGEIFHIYKTAAANDVPIFSHTRGFGMEGIQEAIANATASGASLHIVHANSLSLGEIELTLDMVQSAQANGLDITTEVYPYTAASTSLESSIFDEGWQEMLSISYKDLQWESTGERLTKETFESYRKEGGIVIIHMMKPEWIIKGVSHPVAMIGSDGMPYATKAHPRTAGTFSRVLGKYVREEKALTLMDALKKMTIMPANRLEKVSPMMSRKGRLQIGADADITIFDPQTIIDKADFKGLQYSVGVKHVLINGVLVVEDETIKDNVFPGKAIVSKFKR